MTGLFQFYCGFSFLAGLVSDDAALRGRESSFSSGRIGGGEHPQRCRIAGGLVICLLSAMPMGVSRAAETVFDIDIPVMNAAEALNRLAEQTGAVMLFSYDLARAREVNAVRGRYTLLDGLELLLRDTGLSGGLSNKRVVIIAEEENMLAGKGETVKKRLLAGFIAAVLGSAASDANADQAVESAKLEEIVVTAQKREVSLQDLPISMRALTGEELQRLGADGIEGYAGFVPGLNIVEQTLGGAQIEMRGVSVGSLDNDRPEISPTVGVYFDESPIAAQHFNANIALMDLERIEVMRGPQATLYGANSLSGTIRMITRKPDLAEFEGQLGAGGSYTEHGGGNFDLNGVVNVPLIKDKFALRAVGFYRDDAGYIDNVKLGRENENDKRDVGGRLALRYEPTDYFRLDAGFAYQDSHAGLGAGYFEEAGELNTQFVVPSPDDSELMIASLVAELEFGGAKLTSATSYFGYDSQTDIELSRFARFLTGAPIDGPPAADDFLAWVPAFLERDEFTQEFRFVSKDEGRLTWITGLLFQQQRHDFGEDLPIPGIDAFTGIDSTTFLVEPDNTYKSRIDLETTQLSVFGEVTVTLFDRLSLKGGLRWFNADQDSTTFYGGVFSVPNIGSESADHSENGINPTVNVSYQIDNDRMVYLQAARGFRLGNTNQPIPGGVCADDVAAAGFTDPPDSFASDHLWSYEAGLKTTWLNDRLRVNASGYLIDWKGPQYIVAFDCGWGTIINAGKLDISGFELDVEAALTNRLRSSFGVSYSDSKLGKDVPLSDGVEGDKAPYTPPWKLSLSLDYEFPVAFLQRERMAFVHADAYWVDERITRFPLSATVAAPAFTLSPYAQGNLRAGLYSETSRLEVFIENLWDERPELIKDPFRYSEFPGTLIQTLRPRTFGVRISREF